MGTGFPVEDFWDAHERHWEDAELLQKEERLPNADHLYGLSAECGLKALMVGMGLAVGPRGSVPREYRSHIDQLWDKFRTWADQQRYSGYANALPRENPFEDWSVDQRYCHRSDFQSQSVARHRQGAQAVRGLVRAARQDGAQQ
jgi:hypothetical protein